MQRVLNTFPRCLCNLGYNCVDTVVAITEPKPRDDINNATLGYSQILFDNLLQSRYQSILLKIIKISSLTLRIDFIIII